MRFRRAATIAAGGLAHRPHVKPEMNVIFRTGSACLTTVLVSISANAASAAAGGNHYTNPGLPEREIECDLSWPQSQQCMSAVNTAPEWPGIKALYTEPAPQFARKKGDERWFGEGEVAFARHTDPVKPLTYRVPDDVHMQIEGNVTTDAQRAKNRPKLFCIADCDSATTGKPGTPLTGSTESSCIWRSPLPNCTVLPPAKERCASWLSSRG